MGELGGRDWLVNNLRERVRAAVEAGDAAPLLDPAVPGLARDLAGILAQDAASDVEAMGVLVHVHWIRYQILPEGQDQDDWWACLAWSAELLPVAPDLVPEQVRTLLPRLAALARAAAAAADAATRGSARLQDYQRSGNIEDLQAALSFFRDAVAVAPPDHPNLGEYLSLLMATLAVLHERVGRQADLEEAVAVGRRAVEATSSDHPDRGGRLAALAAALWTRYEQGRQREDLDESIALYREAVAASPRGRSDRPAILTIFAGALQTRYEEDLKEAVTVARQAVEATPPDHPNRHGHLATLATILRTQSGHTRRQEDLDETIAVYREAVAATPPDHPTRDTRLAALADRLMHRYGQTLQQHELDECIALFREAVTATPPDRPYQPPLLSTLMTGLRFRYGQTGHLQDLDEVITLYQKAVAAAPTDHPNLAVYLSDLGGTLLARFHRIGHQDDLERAIAVGRRAVEAALPDDPDRYMYLSNLGNELQARFERIGQQADLDEAVVSLQEAVTAVPSDNPHRAWCLSNLGTAMQRRFEQTGQRADLDEGIALFREVVRADSPPDSLMCLSNLGTALQTRFELIGQQADLEEAVALGRQAVEAAPLRHPNRAEMLSNLGNALRQRFDRTQQQSDLDEALTLYRQAIAATPPDHPDRAMCLSDLAAVLRDRFRFRQTGQQQDLNEAVTVARQAVAATPPDHPNRAAMLSNLGFALRARFELIGQQQDLNEAVTVTRQAVAATPPDHPNRAGRLSNLGITLRARYEQTTQQTDLDDAVAACREGAGVVTASPGRRLAAARQWGRFAGLAGNWNTATEGYAAAVALLPLAAWHGLDQATREYHLRKWPGLAGEAATAAVLAGDTVRAVELLDAGRSVLWTQALNLRRDLDQLLRQRPDLANRLVKIRAILDPSPAHGFGSVDDAALAVAGGPTDDGRAAEQRMLEERRRAARDWDAVVEQVRQLEGFENFLRPVPFAQLRQAAVDGPVVIVNASRHGSHALIVTSPGNKPDPDADGEVEVVDLPAATLDTVIQQVSTLLATATRGDDPVLDPHTVFDVLDWTWRAITEPVLTALGRTNAPPGRVEDWPRIWWCPTGPATFLPLHAAGIHPRTQHQYNGMGETAAIAESVSGRVVSSYTPTLTALTRARNRPAPQQVQVLAVGVPDAPGQRLLPYVHAEIQALNNALPGSTPRTILFSAAATRQAVLDAMPEHTWLHLSCHGVQHPTDASRSAFLLHDQPLTLADLAPLHLPDTDLAYLAACQTATGDIYLIDEALHLAAALQLVGCRHVLATLWNVVDNDAPEMADTIYTHLTHPNPDHPHPSDRPDSTRAAHALHHAVTHLRQTHAHDPLRWAPYIHLGP